jgi:hypothetical protein
MHALLLSLELAPCSTPHQNNIVNTLSISPPFSNPCLYLLAEGCLGIGSISNDIEKHGLL